MTNLSLVESEISEQTVACLEDLLARARQGEIAGLIYLAVLPQAAVAVESTWVGRLPDCRQTLGDLESLKLRYWEEEFRGQQQEAS